ncbi:MAG: CPBP family intramembrane glutamic endopeptidase [Pseudomonadota bacterium]
MTHPKRTHIFLEITAFLILLHLIRLGFDQISWRFAGPLTLAVVLIVVVAYLRHRNISLSKIGLVPVRWPKGVLLILPQTILAFVVILTSGIGIALLGEALNIGIFTAEQPDPQLRWGKLEGNTPLFLFWLAILWFAGPAEELVFRGYMISRLRDVLGNSAVAIVVSIVLPALIFGLGHVYYLGWRGLFVTGMIGVTLGVLFLVYRRNIWPLMIAHAAVNSLVFTAQYLGTDF